MPGPLAWSTSYAWRGSGRLRQLDARDTTGHNISEHGLALPRVPSLTVTPDVTTTREQVHHVYRAPIEVRWGQLVTKDAEMLERAWSTRGHCERHPEYILHDNDGHEHGNVRELLNGEDAPR